MSRPLPPIPRQRIARYSILSPDIPPELQIPSNIIDLAHNKLAVNNYELELDLLDKYSTLIAPSPPKKPEKSPSASSKPALVRDTSVSAVEEMFSNSDKIVEAMIVRCDRVLDADTCRFLLESSDWNLETAVDLFKSTYS